MIVVGVVLLVLALIAAIGVFAGGTAVFTLALGSISWATNSAQVFLTGAAVMLVLLAGAQVTWIGWKRQHRQNKDVRSLRRSAEAAGTTTAPVPGSEPEPSSEPTTGSAPAKLLPETPSPAVGGRPGEPAQQADERPDPGDEIRTRPLEREHRGDTER
jgi:ABC-type nickel/cobalt efflux system permease component RcnA